MTMPKFAVYYVPPAEDDFYRLGTSILGYDVRARESLQMPQALQSRLGGFDQEWVEYAQPFGFHLTIGDALDCDFDDILAVEREIEDILNCFDPAHLFTLQRPEEKFVTFWGDRRETLVLQYDPNDTLKMFHALIVARVNPRGIGSGYVRQYFADPSRYKGRLHQAHRIRKFYSPFILDAYQPHFTLLNPYRGRDHERLERVFAELFGGFSFMTLESICLLVQMGEGGNWRIYREFRREDCSTTADG
jgi:hypothetical protein